MPHEQPTTLWARLVTRRVLTAFLDPLSKSHGWHRIYIISPWISEFGDDGGMSFVQFLKRLKDENATAYIVSRPPSEDWHASSLERLRATGKANIVLLPCLHTKLYCAETDEGGLALMGSANFTAQSLSSLELGIIIRATGIGKHFFKQLVYEAADIYRNPDRSIYCKELLSLGG